MCAREDPSTWLDYELGYSDTLLEDEYRAITGMEETMDVGLTKLEAEQALMTLRGNQGTLLSYIKALEELNRQLFNMARASIKVQVGSGVYGDKTDFEDDSVSITNALHELENAIAGLKFTINSFEETYIKYKTGTGEQP